MKIEQALKFFLPKFVIQNIEARPNLQKIILNAGWLFADKVLRMGVGLFVGVWVARYLGPEQFGSLSYALAFVALFGALSTLGLERIVVRDIVSEPESKDEILGTTFVLKLLGGLSTFGVIMVAISILRQEDILTRWLVGIVAAGLVFHAFDTIDFWFQSQVQSKFTVWPRNITFLIIALVKIVLILVQAPLVAFAWAGLAEVVLGSIGLALMYRLSRHSLNLWRARFQRAKKLLHDSWPLLFSGIMIMIYMRIDQIMLGEMVGEKELGIYSVAVRLTEVWYLVPMIIVSSVFPNIVKVKQIDESLFYKRLQKLYNLMALLAYAVAIPATFVSSYVVTLLFGEAYSAAGPMFAVLVWSIMFTNLGVARSSFLTAMNWTKVHLMTTLGGCVINIVLNYILIPPYGGMGAVIASCVAYWFQAHGSCFFYKPLHQTGYMLTKAMIYPKVWG